MTLCDPFVKAIKQQELVPSVRIARSLMSNVFLWHPRYDLLPALPKITRLIQMTLFAETTSTKTAGVST